MDLKNVPTVMVILGATGDLTSRKIIPALFNLHKHQELPDIFRVVGFSRQGLSDDEFRNKIKVEDESFTKLLSYQQGLFQEVGDYQKLAGKLKALDDELGLCTNKLFYLAVPPQFFKDILNNLSSSGLTEPCSKEEGWTRIIVEKPFGKDLKSAQELDSLLAQLFREEQIYRIDHYLAKEMLQNILSFRFSNNIFDQGWNNKYIESITIRLLEDIGVKDRGAFYDSVGALRDVGQNHLLQMLALVTMDNPGGFDSDAIRTKRKEILQHLEIPSEEEIKNFTYRAQFEGYRNIEGVDSDSNTETYFRVRAFLRSPRWRGVPVVMEAGKSMGIRKKELIVTFKHPDQCLCSGNDHYQNRVVFTLEPEEKIEIDVWSKKPGLKFETEGKSLTYTLRKNGERVQYVEEYEKLLTDCIRGDQTLFVSTGEIKEMWKFTDPIIVGWQNNLTPLDIYKPDTTEALDKAFSLEDAFKPRIPKGKEIGIIGLGKMGANITRKLMNTGWKVTGFDHSEKTINSMTAEGMIPARSIKELLKNLPSPRLVWMMVPADKVKDVLFGKEGIYRYLKKGDIVIDGGNSFYEDALKRHERLKKKGAHFVDIGVSGGPEGALRGASLMIGGDREVFDKIRDLISILAIDNGYQFFEGPGAGHFVKMVHNGIEYGMMQAIAEGFTIMKASSFNLDLTKVADIYNHGSVIESKLIGWMKEAFNDFGQNLEEISSTVSHTGEAEWTLKAAKKMKIEAKVIKEALKFRIKSAENPSYTGKVLSALRNKFGGHKAEKDT